MHQAGKESSPRDEGWLIEADSHGSYLITREVFPIIKERSDEIISFIEIATLRSR
jgi:hypothetical protein